MELLPISASLGAMGSLPGKLDALRDTKLKKEISKLRTRLLQLSKVRDPSQAARSWMEDVRQLSYDMENFVDTQTDWIAKMRRMFKVRVKESNICYDKYQLDRVFPSIDHRLPTVEGGRKTDPVVVGLHEEGGVFDRLCPLLTDGDEQRKVLSIVGVGGIGKTTLAKELWRKHWEYFQCRAFVRTAKKPDMRRMFRSILAQVRPHQPPDASEVHELIHDLREHLRNKRYFIIIDDVWSTSVWDVARRAFPEGNGSRILTTTEIENVALACCSYQLDYIFDMQPLRLSHSKELFTNVLNEMPAYEIIRRCGGSPLAIISISSVIASQGEANAIQNREEVQNNLPTNTTPDDVLKQVLIFCYNSLPSGLQTCLLYLSLYPENYIIFKEDMMKQWVAEGFILAPTENDKMKVAGNYFDKLVDMGMIQHIDVDYSDEVLDYSDEVLYYAVHPTVHDLITSKSIEENFVTVIDYSQGRVRLSSKVSRLSLQFGSATNATTPESIGLSHVRSLAFIGLESCFPPISEFKLLRFLTLHMWADQPCTGVDLKPTSELVLLRSLQVACNDTVHLPDLMQGPIHLETLEINARVAAIPVNIVHLRSWLHLRLGVGTELPDVTGILKNATLNPPISLDDASSPADSVKTINLLSPISRIPQWVRQLTNLCILKLVVRELQPDGIINLQGLPFLAVLSLHVQRRTREFIGFATGAFTALEYFGFRCGVLRLAFEKGAMPNLQRVKLGFNAHRGEQYDRFLVGVKDMLSIQKISVLIGSAAGAEETDLKSAESAFKEAIGRHYSTVSIKRADMVEEEFDQPEQQHSIQEQHPSTPSEHPGGRKESQVNILDVEKLSILGEHPSASSEQPQDVRGPPEKQHSILGNHPSTPSERPGVPKQDPPEQQHSVREQHPSASSEQPEASKQDSETEIKQDSETEIINRLTSPGSPSRNNDYSRLQQPAATPHKDQHLSKKERPTPYMAVGLAKSVVEGTLDKAHAAIQEEAKLRQSTQRDLVFITGELEMMRSFLNIANQERVENMVVRTWVRQVRELAYDVEDCIELVVHLDKTSFWFRVRRGCLPWAPTRMRALDQALEEIEQLKARVEDVSSRNKRYGLISDTGSKPITMKEQLEAAAGSGGTVVSSNMLAEAREAARIAQILGGCDLTQLITKKVGDDLQVIAVWGSGGDHGIASIIRKTYSDPEICRNFTCRAWVKLMYPLRPHDLIQRFMVQFCAAEQQGAAIGMDVLTQDDIFKEFEKIVTEKRYLVVLEGLSNMEDWHTLRKFLPDRRIGSCIIVSTQQPQECVGHSYHILELKQFSAEHSICALFTKGYDGDGDIREKTVVEESSDVGSALKIEGSQDYIGKDEKLALSQVTQNSSYEKTLFSNSEAATSWMITNPLFGRKSELIELRSYIAKARFSNSQVISVWGIAGIGKSALVRNLYYDRMINTDQFNKYRWVDVSRPFNIKDFSRSLLLDSHSEKDPIQECSEFLRQHQCLLVIDDVQSKEEWDSMQAALVSRDSASVIIVITTKSSIATYCTNIEGQVFNVKGLEAAAAFDLFRKEANKKNPSSPLKDYKDVELDELILKCGGLPIVIVVLAALLATQSVTLMDTVRSLNQRFLHFLETSPEFDSLQGLFGWMHSFFRDCPDSLKPCIFYLPIFPPDQNIRRRRLVRRWIAEGYSRDSDELSAEEKGEELFSNLLQLSIIQQLPNLDSTAFNDKRMVSCQVNGFIRENIVSWRMEENLVFELGSNCVLTTQHTGRHLVILKSWDRDRILFESIDFSRLRSLTVFGKWESFFISTSMRLLRVLDLEDTLGVKDADLKNMVQQLRRLKFLSLRGCSEIFHLPSSLGDLRQLQTLDVRHTSIVTLPASITKLQKLQYIRAGGTVPPSTMSSSKQLSIFHRRRSLVGVHVPRGIGKLTALHTLGVVNVGSSGGKAVVEGLKKMTQLRKLGVSGINKHNSKDFIFATSGHVHLESLSVRLDKDSKDCLDDLSLPWENLRSLTLYGLRDMLPLGIPLRKLSKLDLEMDNLHTNGMEFLAKLPELHILNLRVKQLEDGKLHFHTQIYGEELDTFEKVKILEVTCRSSRLHVTFGSKSMKNLELLKIDCSNASYQLTGLNDVPELKEVLLMGTDDEAIKTHLESQLANHPRKPIVKLANTFVLKY